MNIILPIAGIVEQAKVGAGQSSMQSLKRGQQKGNAMASKKAVLRDNEHSEGGTERKSGIIRRILKL